MAQMLRQRNSAISGERKRMKRLVFAFAGAATLASPRATAATRTRSIMPR